MCSQDRTNIGRRRGSGVGWMEDESYRGIRGGLEGQTEVLWRLE